MKLNFVTMALLIVFVLIFVHFAWSLPWTAPRIAGLAIAIPSFLFFTLARIQLGQAFSVRARATTLVTTGLYSRIRNPIYVFGSLMIAGIIIWANRPWLLLIFAVIIPLQIYRSRKEAQVLEEKFGAAYLEYKSKTWF
ncbi:MAG: isoprenylcysteine carboxylmethyltransferase family protein [Terracidiphilus sp.]